jgi:hypothetical protein
MPPSGRYHGADRARLITVSSPLHPLAAAQPTQRHFDSSAYPHTHSLTRSLTHLHTHPHTHIFKLVAHASHTLQITHSRIKPLTHAPDRSLNCFLRRHTTQINRLHHSLTQLFFFLNPSAMAPYPAPGTTPIASLRAAPGRSSANKEKFMKWAAKWLNNYVHLNCTPIIKSHWQQQADYQVHCLRIVMETYLGQTQLPPSHVVCRAIRASIYF